MDKKMLAGRLGLIKDALNQVDVRGMSNLDRILACIQELERLVDLLSQEEPAENNQIGG